MRSTVTTITAIFGAGLLLALSGCAPSAEDSTPEAGGSEVSIEDWRQGIDDCMLEAGFDLVAMSDAGGISPSMTAEESADFDAAYTACIDEVGEAPIDESVPTEDEIFESQLVFAGCMRDAGYDYADPVKADPVKGDGGMSAPFGPEVDPDVVDACSAKGQEAIQ